VVFLVVRALPREAFLEGGVSAVEGAKVALVAHREASEEVVVVSEVAGGWEERKTLVTSPMVSFRWEEAVPWAAVVHSSV